MDKALLDEVSLRKAIEDYLESKKDLWSASSIYTARAKLVTCIKISPNLNPLQLISYLKEKNYKLYTIQIYLTVCSKFEKFYLKTSKIADFLKENFYVFRNAYVEKTRRFTKTDFKRMLREAPSDGAYNMFILMGRCGLRRMEALKARWQDIEEGFIRVEGKGNFVRRVPILDTWLRKVDHHLISGGRSGCHYYLSKQLYSFHDFRSFFATNVANHPELNLKDAAVLLGHKSITTTQKYVRLDANKQKQVLTNRNFFSQVKLQ